MKGFLVLEDGTVFRGESVGAEGFAFGEAVFTTAMTGYQEVVTDPSFAEQIVCFTAPMVGNYGVAADRSESGHVFVRAAIMREARGPAWTDWLVERRSGAVRHRYALARHPPARPRSDEVRGRRRRLLGRRSAGRGRGAAFDGRTSARRRSLDARAVRRRRAGSARDRRRRLRLQALDRPASGRVRRGGHRLPARRRCGRARRFDGVLLSTAPGTRGRFTRRLRPCANCSATFPCSASAWDTSCSPSPAATRRSSSSSDIAAPITRCRASHRPRARDEPEPRFRRRPERGSRGDARVALRRHGRGPRFPELRARSVQFHPEAGPGPHDAWPILGRWVEEVSGLAKAA